MSNAASLGMISQNNHVYQFAMRIEGNGPVCRLEKIGRNKASTFTGLCADHDAELFRPIDRKELSLEDPEQLFLIAYRAVTRELHVCLEGAMRIQNSYQRLVAEGKISNDEPSPQGQATHQHSLKAWAAWKYRYKYFDLDIVKRTYRSLRHSIFTITDEKPCVAASAFFSVEPKPWGNVHPAVALNIIPLGSTYLAVIFCYHRDHSSKVRKYIAPIMMSKGNEQKFELSILMIDRIENFFLSPNSVDSWSLEKRQLIENSFFSSLFRSRREKHPDLMLFS